MKIKLSEIGFEGQRLEMTLTEAWIQKQLADVVLPGSTGSGIAEIAVRMVRATITVNGMLKARFQVPCSRCLGPAVIDVSAALHMVFAPRPARYEAPEEVELTADDLDFAYYEGDEIDLDPLLREQLILGVPIAPLCRPDCVVPLAPKDERPGAGEERGEEAKPVDPRWAPLLALTKQTKPDKK